MTGPPPMSTAVAPGWYPDPWKTSAWRWWDGHSWTAHVSDGQENKPRLPSWLSVPVLVAGLFTAPTVAVLAYLEPAAIALGLVPLLIVVPVLLWLDRVEPEPRNSRLHALLWGATVAGLVAATVNTIVALGSGEAVAAVVSAPLVEEAAKGLGIYWAVRRHEVDSVMDGIVYAGWVAVGFAVLENFTYFTDAAAADALLQVFVLRALVTPFAHPLFTAWTGLAIGLAVARRQSIAVNALWGFGLAAVTHAAWNGSLVYSEETGDLAAVGIAALCFVVLFLAAIATVVTLRKRQQQDFLQAVPMLAQRYGMSPQEVQVFGHWRQMLHSRRQLPRSDRARFDNVHAALARLAMLHRRPGPLDPADEARLADQLRRARTARGPT